MRLVILAGHSSISRGASYIIPEDKEKGIWDLSEYSLNLHATSCIKSTLRFHSLPTMKLVDMPNSHWKASFETPYPQCLNNRINWINEVKPDLCLEIHHDIAAHQDAEGKSRVNGTLNHSTILFVSEKGKTYAQLIQDILKSKNRECRIGTDIQIRNSELAFLRKTNSPSLIVECGFMTGDQDYKILREDPSTIWSKIADAVLALAPNV